MSAPAPRRAAKKQQPVATVTEVSPVPASANVPIETEEVAALAYSYWEARGFQGGSQDEDWLRAEHELRTGA